MLMHAYMHLRNSLLKTTLVIADHTFALIILVTPLSTHRIIQLQLICINATVFFLLNWFILAYNTSYLTM